MNEYGFGEVVPPEETYELPKQMERILSLASVYFSKHNQPLMQQLVVNARYRVQEGYDYDNWNGGQHGHALHFQLPSQLYFEIVDQLGETSRELSEAFNRLSTVQNEHSSCVFFELLEGEDSQNWRERSGVVIHQTPTSEVGSTRSLLENSKVAALRVPIQLTFPPKTGPG